jgi:broad specificity phosphatase PhoE
MKNNGEGESDRRKTTISESSVRPSISLRLIRHAESYNNEVYRNARYIYRGGTPDFDQEGWENYVDMHRSADPSLSEIGKQQSEKLADFLVPHLAAQASRPVRIITSPMRRTLETVRPTLLRLEQLAKNATGRNTSSERITQVHVNGFYFESEGCHTKDKPEEGMTPEHIRKVLEEDISTSIGPEKGNNLNIDFVGFPDMDRGWYCSGNGAETRAESEARASKFYLWLCEHLDQQLLEHDPVDGPNDLFDAGVAIPGEEGENEHDKQAPRQRRRRVALLIGHGDFMSLLLKRIVAGFGHYVETTGIPHRSAFTHYNTGITELEYFGHGRFLVMSHNQTPHLTVQDYVTLRSGGSLKDGWSYLVPNDEIVLNAEVSVAFSDEDMEEHVREQTQALKALYLSSESDVLLNGGSTSSLSVEKDVDQAGQQQEKPENMKHFIVKRGLQVVGVATYSERTGRLTDVAVRPSAGKQVSEALFNAVREHSKGMGRSGSLLVMPRSEEGKVLFQEMGFREVADSDEEHLELLE